MGERSRDGYHGSFGINGLLFEQAGETAVG
jgi:hypothetical protein